MSNNIKKQLQKLDVSKLRLKNGNSVEKELKKHGSILCDCIMFELDRVYNSYSPIVYKRSYDLYNSLFVDDSIEIRVTAKGQGLSLAVKFDDGAIHTGITGEKANVAVLLNEGWQTHGSFGHVPYLGYREGTHFIEAGIERYKKTVNNPFAVCVDINNEERHM